MQNQETEWENIQKEIEKYLVEVLYRIEWYYGDNRAPFIFPPIFKVVEGNKYCCEIFHDDGENGLSSVFVSETPYNVLEEIKKEVPKLFHVP